MVNFLKGIGVWLLSIPVVIFYPILACFGYSMQLAFYRHKDNKGEENGEISRTDN